MSLPVSELFKEFIEFNDRNNFRLNSLPVRKNDQQVQLPITPVERWSIISGKLVKTFKFKKRADRARFVASILKYEQEVGHFAKITILSDQVKISVITVGIDRVTELDYEYAKFIDSLFRDITFS